MRDPARIERIMNKLNWLWLSQFPDWRLGQLIENLAALMEPQRTVFYAEDDAWEAIIDELLRSRGQTTAAAQPSAAQTPEPTPEEEEWEFNTRKSE